MNDRTQTSVTVVPNTNPALRVARLNKWSSKPPARELIPVIAWTVETIRHVGAFGETLRIETITTPVTYESGAPFEGGCVLFDTETGATWSDNGYEGNCGLDGLWEIMNDRLAEDAERSAESLAMAALAMANPQPKRTPR
jgi:hypothetical protein